MNNELNQSIKQWIFSLKNSNGNFEKLFNKLSTTIDYTPSFLNRTIPECHEFSVQSFLYVRRKFKNNRLLYVTQIVLLQNFCTFTSNIVISNKMASIMVKWTRRNRKNLLKQCSNDEAIAEIMQADQY